MASVEKISFDGKTKLGVNVSGIVGYAGTNYKDEVSLIQELFNYIAKGLNRGAIGLGGLYKIPEMKWTAKRILRLASFKSEMPTNC